MLALVPSLNATFLFLLTLSAGAINLLHSRLLLEQPQAHALPTAADRPESRRLLPQVAGGHCVHVFMERHALIFHNALARRGHRVHVFTSAPSSGERPPDRGGGETGPFDVVHSESVALLHRWALDVPNLAVSWHGISLEVLHSGIYQDLDRGPDEPMSPGFNRSLAESICRVLNEIRFFHDYAHHVTTSDSTGEMLRDVYQIPSGRIHVIVNGVDEDKFAPDARLGAVGVAVRRPRGQRGSARAGAAVEAEGVLQLVGRVLEPHAEAAGTGLDVDGGDAVREAGGGDEVPEHQGDDTGGRGVGVRVLAECGGVVGGVGEGGGGREGEAGAEWEGVQGVRQFHVRCHQDGLVVRKLVSVSEERDILHVPLGV
ncbi:hypothetical protein C4D60_Mb04t08220 [Musa balbisiana]|uniref:Glycosyltransferase subfamily 4-like N-terminal domain-containing protein n=1 Tax=Musa balbisiana TaxID=52838 RepID=A0A4S8KAJ9_MUSBA|nr:hypothetical protein C4D60_Mb04t08220 [Musa balbisiana]